MIELQKIAEVLNREFALPFLEKGSVEAKIKKRDDGEFLVLRIGRRDIEVDENFTVTGAGTCLRSEVKDEPKTT